MRDMPPAAITGVGLVLPQGAGLEAVEPVFRGESAIAYLSGFPGLEGATAAALADFVPPRGTEDADRAVQFAVRAADEAWARSGLGASGVDPRRVAVLVALSKGGVFALSEAAACPDGRDAWARGGPDAAARAVAARFGVTGGMAAPVTACASGGHAIVWGMRLIGRGVVDAVIVGAAEASIHPLVIGSYRRMGVLADACGDPASSVRPFSLTRRGFAIGEGAAVFVLESEASAGRRGADVVARVTGWAAGAHAASLTDVEASGETLARLMCEAMRRAGIRPAQVDYVHAHGTATVTNDLAEARAIRCALGKASGRVSVSSTKGSHGHLLGAATAVEAAVTALAIRRGEVPATANLTDPDPAIGLDCTALDPRRRSIVHAIKISSGFGGQSLALCLGAA